MLIANCRLQIFLICNLQFAILLYWRAGRPCGAPRCKLNIVADCRTTTVRVAVGLVGANRATPPVVAHVERDLTGSAAPDPILEVDWNDRRRVLLAGIITHIQCKPGHLRRFTT